MSLFIFANSITLTPGTITVYVSITGEFTVHVIDEESGKALPGEMEERVARLMGE
jgi:multicomponent Na+:H+ antiporter subunit E